MAENQYYAEKFVLLVVHVFIDSLFTLYLTYVSYIVIAGLWKFYYVSSNNTMWDYEWTSTRRPVTNPVTGRPTSTRKPVTARIAMRKGGTGKEFTLTSWKTEIAKCSRTRTTWALCERRTSEAIPRAAKFGRIDNSRAVEIETCESGNNHRYAIVGQNLAAERSVMKQNFLEPTRKPQVIYTDNSWNLALICEVDHGIIEKSKLTPHRSKRFEIAE